MLKRNHALTAGLGPADGPVEAGREPPDQDLLHAQELRAEAAADIQADDPDLRWIEPERPGQPVLVLVRSLGRQPCGDPAVITAHRRRGARFEGARRHPLAQE